MANERSETLEPKPDIIPVDSVPEMSEPGLVRVEIDTSAPFESVKEAANRFGGMGFWKPIAHTHASQHDDEILDVVKVEEQRAQLEKDLVSKEKETLEVLKDLETTKKIVEDLKLKLQKEEGNHESNTNACQNVFPSSAPGFILLELKQAKLNLTRTTNDLADIRVTVDLYSNKIEKERMSLEKTRQRLSCNKSKISSLEEELNQTRQKLEMAKDTNTIRISPDALDVTRELQRLSSEAEEFKKIGKTVRLEVLRAFSEIEQTKIGIKTAEIRLVAAKKMKEAARASEALALAEMKALSNSEDTQKSECVTLTFEEYSSLISRARAAEETYKAKTVVAMAEVDEANVSKTEFLKKVEEVTEEVKISKKALEEALSRVEEANRGKLAVEEALRKWRSEKKRAVHNSTKFKNSHPSIHRKESHLVDVNFPNLVSDELKPVLKPTLSIGQILSRKLLLTEEYENGMQGKNSMGKHKSSLGQMLSKPNVDSFSGKISGKENTEGSAKRKKFSFARISFLVTKQSKKKKKKNCTAISMCGSTMN